MQLSGASGGPTYSIEYLRALVFQEAKTADDRPGILVQVLVHRLSRLSPTIAIEKESTDWENCRLLYSNSEDTYVGQRFIVSLQKKKENDNTIIVMYKNDIDEDAEEKEALSEFFSAVGDVVEFLNEQNEEIENQTRREILRMSKNVSVLEEILGR